MIYKNYNAYNILHMYNVQFVRKHCTNTKYYICTLYSVYCIVYSIDPLSEGLVTPPLGVEKLSPRLNFFDNMFSCITAGG